MIFPHTSSTYCLHSIPKDTGMWLVQFFGSYCITLLGRIFFYYFFIIKILTLFFICLIFYQKFILIHFEFDFFPPV